MYRIILAGLPVTEADLQSLDSSKPLEWAPFIENTQKIN